MAFVKGSNGTICPGFYTGNVRKNTTTIDGEKDENILVYARCKHQSSECKQERYLTPVLERSWTRLSLF